MTDKSKYSNISVSKRTYADLQKLAKGILPGRTSLSISKTVDVLVNEKLQENVSSLTTLAEAEKITGGLDLWGQSENFTPPKNIINCVEKNSDNKKGDENDG